MNRFRQDLFAVLGMAAVFALLYGVAYLIENLS